MANNIPRILIETIVRKTLKDMKESPERSSRNLVDLALNFSEGRFQRSFLEMAQEMLRNEQSAYYGLIQDIIASVDTERIVTFGMNIGYNSCTEGARIIREIEAKENFNVPWSVSLKLDGQTYPSMQDKYRSVIEQGKEMGVFTWLLFAESKPSSVLALVKAHPDCAFILFCAAGDITEAFMETAEGIYNLMLAVQYGEQTAEACARLRKRGFLYSVYVPYKTEAVSEILNGSLLHSTENMHAVFTFLLPDLACPEAIQKSVYAYIIDIRKKQNYLTFSMDVIHDNCFIDEIISDDGCIVGFNEKGQMISFDGNKMQEKYNLFKDSLQHIFKLALQKRGKEQQKQKAD